MIMLPVALFGFLFGAQPAAAPQAAVTNRVKVFLDCPSGCFDEYLRDEITFVEYMRDRTDADVHVMVTRAEAGAGGREYAVSFIGVGRFNGVTHALTSTSTATDTEDRIRRGLATALTIGLLNYVAAGGLPPDLNVGARLGEVERGSTQPAEDPWNRWIFSVRGQSEFQAEASARELSLGLSLSADRITPDWKISFGGEFDHRREQFDLDEDEPFETIRRERGVEWLVVQGRGEHWSLGTQGHVRSSTFDNAALEVAAAPAVEWNFFPYSAYTRRQLRLLYRLGAGHRRYYEETLFGKLQETLGFQEISTTYEQREPWGSLEARVEWFNYLPEASKYRLEFYGDVSLRLARGLSVSVEGNASRIRDQIYLPSRGATSEEVLLRIRRLKSGYEFGFDIGITYQFGSVYRAIVNPRFGQ
jgi:hypothetical protein